MTMCKTRVTWLWILAFAWTLVPVALPLTQVGAQETPPTFEKRPKRPPVRLRPPRKPTSRDEAKESKKSKTDDELPDSESNVEFQPISPRTKVTFNLEDADLPDLVRLMSNMTGRRFILPGKVRSIKATVFAPTKVTAGEAYNAFLSILEVNGLTVIPSGKYLKIVETGGVESKPLPIYQNKNAPRIDRFVTQLYHVEHVSAEDISTLLSRFKSKEGNITTYAPTNLLIITDTGTQIRRMLKLLKAIDAPRTGTQTWIEPIHYASAADVASRLQEIFPINEGSSRSAAASTSSSSTNRSSSRSNRKRNTASGSSGQAQAVDSGIRNVIADERTNSLIIVASEKAYLRILEMIRHLDVPLEGEGKIHVHYVQHSAAADIASALSNMVGSGTQRRPGARPAGGAAAASQSTAAFDGDIRITSYEPANALIITASLHDYEALRRVIERLDAPRKQVFIEAVVMEVAVRRNNNVGVSFHGGLADQPTDGALSILGFNAGNTLTPVNDSLLTGLALGISGPTIDGPAGLSIPGFGVALNAIANSGDVNVLSTPHLIAMDNVQAEITVGENVPLQTSGIPAGALAGLGLGGLNNTTGDAAAATNFNTFGSVPRQDIGTTIRITPHINEADEIRMEIEEEISERGATEGTLGVVSINRRTARTEVMATDQQTVVIGGLMRDTVSNRETKVPVLGDIPLIGALFRNSERVKEKTNLLLFLTPYVIRDAGDLRAIFERKMQERQEFIDRFFVFGDSDYEPPIDYSRTRGLVAEIVNEIGHIDDEVEIQELTKSVRPMEHRPREPIGSYQAPEPTPVLDATAGETSVETEVKPSTGPAKPKED